MPLKNNRGRGRPPKDSERVEVRIERDMINALDAYAGDQDDEPKRPEAIRRILREWLVGHGYLKAE